MVRRNIPFEQEKLLQLHYKGDLSPVSTRRISSALEAFLWSAGPSVKLASPRWRALIGDFATSLLEYKRLVLSREKICANPVNLRFSNPSPVDFR